MHTHLSNLTTIRYVYFFTESNVWPSMASMAVIKCSTVHGGLHFQKRYTSLFTLWSLADWHIHVSQGPICMHEITPLQIESSPCILVIKKAF